MKKNSLAVLVAQYGMLIALAFILSFVETLIPIHLGIPGVKLGLANLVTIVGLYTIGTRGTIAVSLTRIMLVGFTFSNMYSMIYGLAGGILSLLVMILLKKMNCFSQIGVSIAGGIAHNVGQICIAAIVVQTNGVFYYLTVLLVVGTVAGMLIGLLGGIITVRVKKIMNSLNVV